MAMNLPRLLGTAGVTAAIFLSALYVMSKTEQEKYTESMFRHAIEHEGTDREYHSSEYVLITVTGPSGQPSRTACVQAGALLHAILRQQISKHAVGSVPLLTLSEAERNEFGEIDLTAYKEIALSARNQRFLFDDQKAYEIVAPRYDESELSGVRDVLSAYTNQQLRTVIREIPTNSPVHRLYLENHYPVSVVAHALLERGILVGVTMEDGNLYLVAPAETSR
jgi:hypothetical protein